MQTTVFTQGLDDIYASHGKAFPAQKACSAILERVRDLPDSFMAFAVEELRDYASLPSNLGRELRRTLWPEFLDKNPHLRATGEGKGCDFCRNGRGGVGWVYAHEPSSGHTILRKCKCIGGDMPQYVWDAGYELGLPHEQRVPLPEPAHATTAVGNIF